MSGGCERSHADRCQNPRNWSRGRKWYLTILCSYLNVLVASQASVYSTGQAQIVEEFGISDELAIGGLSLYVLGASSSAGVYPALLAILADIPSPTAPQALPSLPWSWPH